MPRKGEMRVKRRRWKCRSLVLGMMLCLMMSAPAFALGITCNSSTKSTSVRRSGSAVYGMSLTYNTALWNKITLPAKCQLGIELPVNVFSKVRFISGSSYMSFTKKSGSVTGNRVYQSYKSYRVIGKATKSFRVRGYAVSKAGKSGTANMGTGRLGFGIRLADYNSVFRVRTR